MADPDRIELLIDRVAKHVVGFLSLAGAALIPALAWWGWAERPAALSLVLLGGCGIVLFPAGALALCSARDRRPAIIFDHEGIHVPRSRHALTRWDQIARIDLFVAGGVFLNSQVWVTLKPEVFGESVSAELEVSEYRDGGRLTAQAITRFAPHLAVLHPTLWAFRRATGRR